MADNDNLPVDQRRYRRDRARVEKGFWTKIRRTLGRVPFVEEVVAAYCARTGRERIADLDFYLAFHFFRSAAILS